MEIHVSQIGPAGNANGAQKYYVYFIILFAPYCRS